MFCLIWCSRRDTPGDIDQMLAKMCQFVKEQDPKYCCVVKVEQSYASALPDKK